MYGRDFQFGALSSWLVNGISLSSVIHDKDPNALMLSIDI
jgi:hypothetical protein